MIDQAGRAAHLSRLYAATGSEYRRTDSRISNA